MRNALAPHKTAAFALPGTRTTGFRRWSTTRSLIVPSSTLPRFCRPPTTAQALPARGRNQPRTLRRGSPVPARAGGVCHEPRGLLRGERPVRGQHEQHRARSPDQTRPAARNHDPSSAGSKGGEPDPGVASARWVVPRQLSVLGPGARHAHSSAYRPGDSRECGAREALRKFGVGRGSRAGSCVPGSRARCKNGSVGSQVRVRTGVPLPVLCGRRRDDLQWQARRCRGPRRVEPLWRACSPSSPTPGRGED